MQAPWAAERPDLRVRSQIRATELRLQAFSDGLQINLSRVIDPELIVFWARLGRHALLLLGFSRKLYQELRRNLLHLEPHLAIRIARSL